MYIRWKKQILHGQNGWNGRTRLCAYLCSSKRIDGKPRQQAQYLASIHQEGVSKEPGAHIRFWAQTLRNLEKLVLKPEQYQAIMDTLSQRVAIPTRPQVEEYKQSCLAFWAEMSVRDENYLLEKLPV